MLVLTEADVKGLLDIRECVDLMEQAYRELGEGIAQNIPRGRIRLEPDAEGRRFWLNCIPGAVPGLGACAVRIDAAARLAETAGRSGARYVDDTYTGLVLLFSTRNGEWLATLPDFTISGIRVAATSALVVRRLARPDAVRLGIIGTGKQARAHLAAICADRPVESVTFFSPNPGHRAAFGAAVAGAVAAPLHPAASAEAVVQSADLVVAATNTIDPVVRGEGLRPGMHVVSIVGGDKFRPRREVDAAAIDRADLIVVNSIEQVHLDRQGSLYEPLQQDPTLGGRLVEIGDLITGRHPGRTDPDQIILYLNNTGQGIQFAAVAMHLYRKAVAAGIGRTVPADWFATDLSAWAADGYTPSA